MVNLMDVLFGCSHRRTTFPITAKADPRSPRVQKARTYVVCLDCGKEFQYDWHAMQMVSSSSPKAKAAAATVARAA